MPTGYTAKVADGELVTFADFAMLCARGVGATIHMRDEPLSAEYRPAEPSDYHERSLTQARDDLARLRAMTPEEVRTAAIAEYESDLARWEQRRADRLQRRERYQTMLARVQDWQPPTEEHLAFKKFMAEQLTSSIDFDCRDDFDACPQPTPPDAWLAGAFKRCERSIAYHMKEADEEAKRIADRNRWMTALMESLGATVET